MIAKIYLIVVALLYLGLAIWCSVAPKATSEKVGFQLIGGSGKSEFLTVYGGLEVGLALVLLYLALYLPETVIHGVVASVLIHGSLVVFRTLGFFLYSDFSSMTYRLAIGEWAILIVGAVILWINNRTRIT